MMKKLFLALVALVALSMPARAVLYEISGPLFCEGSTYTLNGVTYRIYADCSVYGVGWGNPANIYPQKFVAFVESLSGVTTEECVIPATFENSHITFVVGRTDINGLADYKYVYTSGSNFSTPDEGGHPANKLSSTVEVWGFSSKFASSSYGYDYNYNIKNLRFEGDIRCREYTVSVYDDETTTAYIQESPSTRYQYFYKDSYKEGTYKFTEAYKLSLPRLETLSFYTLTGYGVNDLSSYPNLTDVYFTSTTPYQATTPQFYGVGNMTAHLTNSAFAGYLPDDSNGFFAGFKQVLPESVDVELEVDDGAWVSIGGQHYGEGEYTLTVPTPVPFSFTMLEGANTRVWLNGKNISSELNFDGDETFDYTLSVHRPKLYLRCSAGERLIDFEDDEVEAVCVDHWDTNGDGRLSESEALAVTSLGAAFRGNTAVRTFPELQYFTGLTALNDSAFMNCTALETVTLPKTIKKLGKSAFRNCALAKIDLPDGLTELYSYAFAGCKNLVDIDIPEGVKYLPEFCFLDCTSLRRIYIPKTCIRMGRYPIGGCTGLISIIVEDGHPALSSPKGCNALIMDKTTLLLGCRNSTIPEGVKTISNNAFYDQAELTSIELPASLTTIALQAFRNCTGLTSVVSHIREPFAFGTGAFGNISPSCVLTVPHGTRQAYIDKGWTETVFKGGIVEMPLNCDVNQDGTVSIADVTTVVNGVLGR